VDRARHPAPLTRGNPRRRKTGWDSRAGSVLRRRHVRTRPARPRGRCCGFARPARRSRPGSSRRRGRRCRAPGCRRCALAPPGADRPAPIFVVFRADKKRRRPTDRVRFQPDLIAHFAWCGRYRGGRLGIRGAPDGPTIPLVPKSVRTATQIKMRSSLARRAPRSLPRHDVLCPAPAQRLEQRPRVGHGELLQELGAANLDGAVRNPELRRDLLAGEPFCQKGHDLAVGRSRSRPAAISCPSCRPTSRCRAWRARSITITRAPTTR